MREINRGNWEGYMGEDQSAWWKFQVDHDQPNGYVWWSMGSEDGVERVCIPIEHGWHSCDAQLAGQVAKMFGRRRLAYHKMGLVKDPLFDHRSEPMSYWEGILDG